MGAHGKLRGSGVAGVGLEHHGGVGLDQIGDAAQHIKDAGYVFLNVLAVGKGHSRVLAHKVTSFCIWTAHFLWAAM